MGRNRKPRKAYRPGRVDADPVDLAISRAAKLSLVQRLDLMRPLRAAFEGMRMGTAGWPAWCSVADAMNVAEQLAGAGIVSDRQPEFTAAQAALHQVHGRVLAGGSWTLRAAEITALDFAVDLHGIQLQYVSQGEVQDAIEAVKRNVLQALRGNAPRNAKVCVGVLGAHQADALAAATQPPAGAAI